MGAIDRAMLATEAPLAEAIAERTGTSADRSDGTAMMDNHVQ